MNFSSGEMLDERLDEHGRLSLSNEGRSSGNNSFGAGDSHGPEEERRSFDDAPLQNTDIEENADKGDEKDDGWQNCDQEPGDVINSVLRCKEGRTLISKTKQVSGSIGNELEDVITNFRPQHEKSHNELCEHTNNDCLPLYPLAIL